MRADIQLVRRIPRSGWLPWLILLLLCVWAKPGSAADEAVGKVDALTGGATFERAGQTQPASVGADVYLRDKWRTAADGAVEILFVDDSRVKLAGGTVLEITEYLYNPGEKKREGLLSMVSGKARFVVADLQDFKQRRFRVQTQTSVVGTRDTDFSVWVVSELLTKALCIENAIALFNRSIPGKPILLTANMVSEVYGTNLPAVPRFATAAERREFMKGLEDVGGGRESPRDRPQEETEEEAAGKGTGVTTTAPPVAVPTDTPPLLPTLPAPETLPPTVRPPTVTPFGLTTTRPTTPTTTTTRPRPVTLPPPPPEPPPPN
jgi:hypothetical protein